MRYLIEHEVRMPIHVSHGPHKGDHETELIGLRCTTYLQILSTPAPTFTVCGQSTDDGSNRAANEPDVDRIVSRMLRLFCPEGCPLTSPGSNTSATAAQLTRNKPASIGPVRTGSALLPGLLICDRCGRRLNAQYNDNGHTGRYACMHMKTSYGEPFCQ